MIIGAVIFGFCLLAFVYFTVEHRKLEVYQREQLEWREMEKELYKVNAPPDTASPYYIDQSLHGKTNKIGFAVKDTRTANFAGASGWHKWFKTSYEAWCFMNELELIGGYDITDLGIPEPSKKAEEEEGEE